MKGEIFMGLMNNKRLKVLAAGIAMFLPGCATIQTKDVATNEFKDGSSVASSNPETTTNKRIPGVQVQYIADDAYGDEDSVGNDYVQDDVGYTLTTAPLESGTSVLLYTTTVGEDSKEDSGEKDFIVTGRPQEGSKPPVTTAKPVVTTVRTTAKPVVTTARTTAKPVVTTVETTAAPTQPAPVSETQPVAQIQEGYSIDDICNDVGAYKYYAGKLAEQLVGMNGFFYNDVYVYGHLVSGYSVAQYLLAAINFDGDHSCISDEVLNRFFSVGDLEQRINDAMDFLDDYKRIQNESGAFVDFSSFVCSEKNGDGSYSNHLNTLQSYSNNILDYAAYKDIYSYDYISNSLFYAYQNGMDDSLRFITYEDVLNSSRAFNDHLCEVVYGRSYSK